MANLADIERDDPTFVEDLTESHEYVERVAEWLRGLGNDVEVNPLRIRPHISEMGDYADQGDLKVSMRVEVKRRPELSFRSREDFPFPSVIVDVAHTWDNARPKPYAYVILNKDASAALVVRKHTSSQWTKETRRDRKKNRVRTFYLCPIVLCDFVNLAGE